MGLVRPAGLVIPVENLAGAEKVGERVGWNRGAVWLRSLDPPQESGQVKSGQVEYHRILASRGAQYCTSSRALLNMQHRENSGPLLLIVEVSSSHSLTISHCMHLWWCCIDAHIFLPFNLFISPVSNHYTIGIGLLKIYFQNLEYVSGCHRHNALYTQASQTIPIKLSILSL